MQQKYNPLICIKNLKEKGLVKALAIDWQETSKGAKAIAITGAYATTGVIGIGFIAYLQRRNQSNISHIDNT